MKKTILALLCTVLLIGCGTKIEIEDCDNSFVLIEQSSTQRTDNQVPISLTDASKVLERLAALPTVVKTDKTVKVIKSAELEKFIIEPEPMYSKVETYQTKYVEGNPKPHTWLNAPGVAGRILFELPGCDSFLVPDGSVKYSPSGHGYATYFQGSDTPEGLRNGGVASIFMAPGCENGELTVTYESTDKI